MLKLDCEVSSLAFFFLSLVYLWEAKAVGCTIEDILLGIFGFWLSCGYDFTYQLPECFF